ncbi:MAG TPA: CHRD domain-containing protein [Rhizomicrobium sp.]|nr:CHRD domain-containing protein [Rhizomicrobium sp.]
MKAIWNALAVAVLVGWAQGAVAAPILFKANLSGANEFPANASPGTGLAEVTIDSAAHTMLVDASFSGLLGTTTAAHIHCCLASPFLTGVNVGVATTTPNFPGFPLGVTSGAYSQIFDMSLASSYSGGFLAANGGDPLAAEATLFAAISAGKTYFNLHSSAFPGGEIRGFLVQAPEPLTLSVFGAGLAGAVLMRRRRKTHARAAVTDAIQSK